MVKRIASDHDLALAARADLIEHRLRRHEAELLLLVVGAYTRSKGQ